MRLTKFLARELLRISQSPRHLGGREEVSLSVAGRFKMYHFGRIKVYRWIKRQPGQVAMRFRGALMPDAHVGYGLSVGGVFATDNAVIPYAVGVAIACPMKLTVYDRKANTIASQRDRLANIKQRRKHEVMDVGSGRNR